MVQARPDLDCCERVTAAQRVREWDSRLATSPSTKTSASTKTFSKWRRHRKKSVWQHCNRPLPQTGNTGQDRKLVPHGHWKTGRRYSKSFVSERPKTIEMPKAQKRWFPKSGNWNTVLWAHCDSMTKYREYLCRCTFVQRNIGSW